MHTSMEYNKRKYRLKITNSATIIPSLQRHKTNTTSNGKTIVSMNVHSKQYRNNKLELSSLLISGTSCLSWFNIAKDSRNEQTMTLKKTNWPVNLG